MRVDLFDFELPEERIALRPVEPRDAARLLIVNPNNSDTGFKDKTVLDLPSFLNEGDALVFNDTKVIPAQLNGIRKRGEIEANISITLHMRVDGANWKGFAKPAKKLQIGDKVHFSRNSVEITADVMQKADGGEVTLAFDKNAADLDAAIAIVGHIPLPPYIAGKRGEDERDLEDYQTIYAKESGAVAAPTAGLHTTERLLEAVRKAGVETHFVTLHVGAGTFLPVKADDTSDHKMHSEIGVIDQQTADALNAVKKRGGRIVSVGTTSLRLLESASDENGMLNAYSDATDIFITPGYRFRFVDMLMTNFHLPRSTLFMLVSAFCGQDVMQNAYAHAIEKHYRFYSYGDASLLFKSETS